jgi:ABC-type polysaccharide/polyol phosphate transport system ATPase subunit
MSTAIEVRGISKRFRLYQEQFTSLKERILHGGRVPYEDFWALKDIQFEVGDGKTFGLLGHNGSGKSTLLKIICGIIQPTSGEVVTRGRVAALLELGAGFQAELSGRENIYLNASLLGMSRSYVDAHFDEIVDFAELAPFIDNQVKFYSSGMYVRLGFAVAVNMDPDILIVDEVLAVGDELFQRKCLERVKRFQKEGRTIVVVSHSPDLLRQVCTDAAVLDHGMLVGIGTPGEAVRSFREHLLRRKAYAEADRLSEFVALTDDDPEVDGSSRDLAGQSDEAELGAGAAGPALRSKRNSDLVVTSVRFEHEHSDERHYIHPNEALTIRIGYHARTRLDDVLPGIAVYDQLGNFLFGANSKLFPAEITVEPGYGEFVFELPRVPLLDGTYPVTVGLLTNDEITVYDWREQEFSFAVMNPDQSYGMILVPTDISVHHRNGDESQLSGKAVSAAQLSG